MLVSSAGGASLASGRDCCGGVLAFGNWRWRVRGGEVGLLGNFSGARRGGKGKGVGARWGGFCKPGSVAF